MTIRQRWKQTALHNKFLVIIGGLGLIVAAVQAIRSQITINPGAQSGGPLLHASPSVRDTHVRWDNGEFSPHPEQGADPFVITVNNIGDRNAINLIFTFVLKLDIDELIKMAKKSTLFSSKPIEGDAKRLTIPTRYSLSEVRSVQINLSEENVRRRDEIQAHSQITVQYPPNIKNAIVLWLLITSHSQGTTWRTKEKDEIVPDDPSLMKKYFEDQLYESQRASIIVLPDVTIAILYQDVQQNTFSTSQTIRSIYKYKWLDDWAQWTRDEQPRRLGLGDLLNAWLVFHGIALAPGDYSAGHPEGGEDQILTWNEAKLGPKPTKEELFFMPAFIRDHEKVLSGGQGVLSYEDANNPSEGWYNIYKNRDLFTPRIH